MIINFCCRSPPGKSEGEAPTNQEDDGEAPANQEDDGEAPTNQGAEDGHTVTDPEQLTEKEVRLLYTEGNFRLYKLNNLVLSVWTNHTQVKCPFQLIKYTMTY